MILGEIELVDRLMQGDIWRNAVWVGRRRKVVGTRPAGSPARVGRSPTDRPTTAKTAHTGRTANGRAEFQNSR